jgi:hypothetical protein
MGGGDHHKTWRVFASVGRHSLVDFDPLIEFA